MRFKMCVISPLVALALGACQLSDKNLGEANPDSDGGTVGSTEGQTSAPKPDPGMTTAPETTTGTTEPATTSGTTFPPETLSDTDGLETTTRPVETTTGDPGVCGDPLEASDVSKECQVDEDCLLVFHQTDCCASVVALGIDADSLAAYNVAEEPCAIGAVCDCAPKHTLAEDGQAGASDSFGVACVDNQCQSQVVGPPLLVWHETCGDGMCTGRVEQEGIEKCWEIEGFNLPGQACEVEGVVCDHDDPCNALLVCGFKDPKLNGC